MNAGDDTKILAEIKESSVTQDTVSLQNDIDKITDWTNTWLMLLNISKCKILHVGKSSPKSNYTTLDYDSKNKLQIFRTECEGDLGILISENLESKKLVNFLVSKANSIPGLSKRTLTTREQLTWKKFELAVSSWSQYTQQDQNTLEKVQQRATKVGGDLIQMFKV